MAAEESPEIVLRKIFRITMVMSVMFFGAAMVVALLMTENVP